MAARRELEKQPLTFYAEQCILRSVVPTGTKTAPSPPGIGREEKRTQHFSNRIAKQQMQK
jgi:hypothetical protein